MANRKKHSINVELRREIIEGKFPPGIRLPTRDELQVRYGASRQTLQNVMDGLIRDGFVHASCTEGTFVAEKPPHLYNYGLVTYQPFSLSRYFMAMQEAAVKLAADGEYSFTSYCYDEGRVDSAGFKRLVSDVESHRVAGLIFISPPYHLEKTPVLLQKGFPRVMNSTPGANYDMPRIYPRHREFLERAVDYLVGQGRKKIALLACSWNRPGMEDTIAYMVQHGKSRPALIHECDTTRPWSAMQTTLLLTELSEDKRPDALIIHDDHLVEAATEGLAKSNLRIPQDIAVVAHCNFPNRPSSYVPVTRLGLDCVDLLKKDMECLTAQRLGKKYRKEYTVPFVFESELGSQFLAERRRSAEGIQAIGYGRQKRSLHVAV